MFKISDVGLGPWRQDMCVMTGQVNGVFLHNASQRKKCYGHFCPCQQQDTKRLLCFRLKSRPLCTGCDINFRPERYFGRLHSKYYLLSIVTFITNLFLLAKTFSTVVCSFLFVLLRRHKCTSKTPQTKKCNLQRFTTNRNAEYTLCTVFSSLNGRVLFLLLFLSIFQISLSDQHSAPHFVVQPSFSGGVVTEGQSKILQCQAVGFPPPEYKWLKDGVSLGDFTNDPLLRMTRITTDSAGNYQCVARNSAGAIFSQKTALTVAYIISPSEVYNATITVQAGSAAILEPPFVDSVPNAVAHWQKVGFGRLHGRRYVTTKGNKLVILSSEVEDSGQYKVLFTNDQVGQEVTGGYINLTVTPGYLQDESNPSIVIPPRDSIFEQGASPSVLECIANASPLDDLQIIWSKDGVEMTYSGLSHFLSPWNHSLTLLNVVPSHGGRYWCEANLRVVNTSAVRAEATVNIRVKPIVTNPPGPETVSELGNNVILPCGVTGSPPPTVNWYRNAVAVGHEPEGRYSTSANGSLLIATLTSADAGIFQCMAENSVGEATVSTWLHVKTSPPVFIQQPENITVLDGRDGQITCETSGAPKPNVAWFLNDSIPVYSSGRHQILENGMLLIATVEPKDVGSYTCIRSNSAGTISGSAFLTVLVRTQIVQPPVATRVILSSTAELQCKVSHDPSVPFSVSWFYNDKPIGMTSGGRIQVLADGTLQIGQARNTDVGIYTCRVTSSGGNDSRSAKLDVIELPHPPNNVQAVVINTIPKSINISWSKGFDGNSPINAYVVQMRVVPTTSGDGQMDPIVPWQTAKSNISGDYRFTILKGLKPSSSYQFRVIAVNGVGEGNPSLPTETIVLPSEPPGGPPQGVLGAARSSTSIMLQWQPPNEEDRNGDILGYEIRYKLAGYSASPWAYQNVTNAAQHSFLLQDLIVWQNYLIQVSAYNRKGVGVYSEGIFIRTKEGVPQSAPSQVLTQALNSTAVEVKWKPPDPQLINGINQGYRVETWRGDPGSKDALFRSILVPPSPLDPLAELKAVVTNLEKYTWYNVTVLCLTAPGDGPLSSPVEVITNQDVPEQVGPLKFEEILDTSVTVLWSPPVKANGILLGYTLKYHIKNNQESSVIKNVTAETMRLSIDGLRPITAYTFQIYAWTVIGNGPPRTATIQSGIPPVLPEPPTKLAVSNIGPFSVVLQFTPGFDGNSSIIKWTVEAHTRRNETWFTVYEVSDPEAATIEVHNLTPFTEYRLRLLATNVVGTSRTSEPSKYFQTIQAPPSHAPYNVTVRAVNAKALRVRWTPLQQGEWFGIPRGYNISFRAKVDEQIYQSDILEDHNANSFVLRDLEEFTEYEVFVQAFNDVGISPASSVAVERTRESVPFVGPALVEANATSSTTIVVKWGEVPKTHQNGIIEGYKVYYGAKTVPFSFRIIEGNATFTSTLTELKKYTLYSIQVLAYTRVGDGALSLPPISVRTYEDVPDVPSNISFPDVSTTTARIIWDVPAEPNGEILAYKVSYGQENTREGTVTKELPAAGRTLKTFNLKPETNYVFSVTAKTNEGWGNTASAPVYTTNKREAPQPPSAPRIRQLQIQPRQITFSWNPGSDGSAPLRYYTIEMARGDGPWRSLPTKVDPALSTYTVTSLQPFTWYKFRIQATNDIGASGWSLSSNLTRTLPAAPAEAPQQVAVTPHTTTSVTVTWQPLGENQWNGDMQNPGYRIEYCPVSSYTMPQSGDCPSIKALGANASSLSLENLEKDRIYEIKVFAFNGQGDGPAAAPVAVYVGEAVPTGEPRDVRVEAASSTEIKVFWKPPLATLQNGDLLGYKIFYQSEIKGTNEEMEAVPVSTTTYVLMDLLKFRDYRIQVLAFNPAGDGPRSQPLFVRTLEDLPGPPAKILFTDVTMTSLNVSWSPPFNPNGRIRGYLITYETAQRDDDFSKQVKQKVTHTYLPVHGLRSSVAYTFNIRCETVGLGPEAVGNVTTGPQDGSPGTPQELQLRNTQTSVTLNWRNGPSGAAPIRGYLIEAQLSEESDSDWITLVQLTNGPQVTYTVSFQNLLPSKHYLFRLFARNKYGISYPAEIQQPFATPSKLYLEYKQKLPFYREIWFLVTLAASGVIVVILVVAVLCVKSKSYKYKQETQKSIQDDHLSMDDGGFATFELRQSKRGTLCKNTLSRKGNSAVLAKSPPRPSPASITYSDEEDVKGYDDNCDSSSLTEKPSEISSTDSQATDSDRESDMKSEPHSFVNHYANVNDTFRQSWKRQRPVKPPSYTDSEPEGSVAVSLNGGHIIMNNMAGSRAPLPGFSSFV